MARKKTKNDGTHIEKKDSVKEELAPSPTTEAAIKAAFEEQIVDDTAEVANETPEPNPDKGCYALIAKQEPLQFNEVYGRTKQELAERLTAFGEDWHLIGLYQGKKLTVQKTISLI